MRQNGVKQDCQKTDASASSAFKLANTCKANKISSKGLENEGKKGSAQRGARTHDPEIKSLMLYRLS